MPSTPACPLLLCPPSWPPAAPGSLQAGTGTHRAEGRRAAAWSAGTASEGSAAPNHRAPARAPLGSLPTASQAPTKLLLVGVGARVHDVVQHRVGVQPKPLRDGADALGAAGGASGAAGGGATKRRLGRAGRGRRDAAAAGGGLRAGSGRCGGRPALTGSCPRCRCRPPCPRLRWVESGSVMAGEAASPRAPLNRCGAARTAGSRHAGRGTRQELLQPPPARRAAAHRRSRRRFAWSRTACGTAASCRCATRQTPR